MSILSNIGEIISFLSQSVQILFLIALSGFAIFLVFGHALGALFGAWEVIKDFLFSNSSTYRPHIYKFIGFSILGGIGFDTLFIGGSILFEYLGLPVLRGPIIVLVLTLPFWCLLIALMIKIMFSNERQALLLELIPTEHAIVLIGLGSVIIFGYFVVDDYILDMKKGIVGAIITVSALLALGVLFYKLINLDNSSNEKRSNEAN